MGFCHDANSVTWQFRRCLGSVLVYDSRARAVPWVVDEFDLISSGVHVPDARCDMVRAFLDHPLKPEWLWMVDADATFGPTILDELLEAAHPDTAPIVGALAFGVQTGQPNELLAAEQALFPTLYFFDAEHNTGIAYDYPPDELVQVHSTGCHCFVVHRSVLEDPRWIEDGSPLPWFRVVTHGERIVSEDQFFFLMAGRFGYPVHVHTGIKTGHVKTFVAEEEMFLRQQAHRAAGESLPVQPEHPAPLESASAEMAS